MGGGIAVGGVVGRIEVDRSGRGRIDKGLTMAGLAVTAGVRVCGRGVAVAVARP